VNIRTPDFPVTEKIVERVSNIGTEVNVIGTIGNLAAAVVPKEEGIEILVLRVVVGIGETSICTARGNHFDPRAVDLEMISIVTVHHSRLCAYHCETMPAELAKGYPEPGR